MRKALVTIMSITMITAAYSQIQISRNMVWNRIEDLPIGYENGFEITNNANVIINELNIGMAPGAQIIVNNGCYLQISNTMIYCNDKEKLWNGILVKGDSRAIQRIEPVNGFRSQGVLLLRGNTTAKNSINMEICNAKIGVEVESGAICQSINTRFINCPKGVVIRPYSHHKNLCLIESCLFNWENSDALAHFVSSPHEYISEFRHIELGEEYNGLSGVNGVTIYACEFSNYLNPSSLNLSSITQLGLGIYALNSYYYILKNQVYDRGVLNPPAPTRVNSFNNLFQGICFCGTATQGDLDTGINNFFNCKLDISLCNNK